MFVLLIAIYTTVAFLQAMSDLENPNKEVSETQAMGKDDKWILNYNGEN